MKLLHSMDAESGDLRPNHNLKLVFSPVRHVYHRSAVFQILPFLQFLLRMDLYIPFHRSKSYIRIFSGSISSTLRKRTSPMPSSSGMSKQTSGFVFSFSVKQKFTRFSHGTCTEKIHFSFFCSRSERKRTSFCFSHIPFPFLLPAICSVYLYILFIYKKCFDQNLFFIGTVI